MITFTHYFYILKTRPWPLISSLRAFNLIFSLLIFFKFQNFLSFFYNFLNISLIRFFWWFHYRGENNLEGSISSNLEKGLKFSIILFISSEVLFFFSFFWSYFHFFLRPTIETGSIWPPFKIEMFDYCNVPLINTLLLLTSGVTITISHYFLIENENKKFNFFLLLTIFLGLIFTFLQVLEYLNSFFSIRDSTFGTSFFVLTGFHGIHVIVGTLFLISVFYRSLKNMISSSKNFLRFELSSWYWHFVDVVWIFLYFIIYYLNN